MLVPGVVGLSIMFQGIQAVAMPMAQEFGFTREIEDRVRPPAPSGSWRSQKSSPARPRV